MIAADKKLEYAKKLVREELAKIPEEEMERLRALQAERKSRNELRREGKDKRHEKQDSKSVSSSMHPDPSTGGPIVYSLVEPTPTPVPGPIVGAGIPGLIASLGGLLVWWRRRNFKAV